MMPKMGLAVWLLVLSTLSAAVLADPLLADLLYKSSNKELRSKLSHYNPKRHTEELCLEQTYLSNCRAVGIFSGFAAQ